ncbi:MAG TPA: hypothetical protein DEB40_03920 [Elusimicrobia bacterium]|nr:hypothetical protein [Elusimicrobiota bacterium]
MPILKLVRTRTKTLLLALALALTASARAWSTTEENEAAPPLTAEATEFLDQLLGPGRAKILVTVEGEKSEARTQTEVVTPIKKPQQEETPARFLPGYSQNPTQKATEAEYLQKDQEQTLRLSGLIIKNLHATVILDTGISEAQADMARRVLPDLLRLDANRGDILTVLRAPLLPPWRRMVLGSEGLMRSVLQDGARALFYFAIGLALLFFMGLLGYLIAMSLIKTFVSEIGRVRGMYGEQPAIGAAPSGRVEELPEILPGGIPGLSQADDASGAQRPVAALGRRFDFLTAHSAADLADFLAKEKPEDLALLFGNLADTNEAVATRLFAALPAVLQSEVSQNLSRLTMADPERLAMLENRLRTVVDFGIHGADRLGRILSRIPAQQREGILGDMMSRDPAAAEKVESSMIPFESLGDLQTAELRRLLTAVPYPEWGVALRGAPEELIGRVMELLPAEAQAALRDYREQPQPLDKVVEARSKILTQAYALAAQGQLTLKREQSSELL